MKSACQQRCLAMAANRWQRTLTAQRTVAFVKSMFEVANPSEAKGQRITAREILDRGALQYGQGLRNEPIVKAELGTTLGEVYIGLGFFKQGRELIESTLRLPGRDPEVMARQFAALGDVQMKHGEYETSLPSYAHALALTRMPEANGDGIISRILVGMSEAQSSLNRFDDAARSARAALKLDEQRLGRDHPDVARDSEAMALNSFFSGKHIMAVPLLERAIAIRIKAQGMLHPKVTENFNMLGAIAYMRRDNIAAERYYRRVLQSDEQVLGRAHPDLAITLNNLARVILEREDFANARELLERSITITIRQRSDNFDDLAFAYPNLAIAERGLGNTKRAEELFRKALPIAERRRHRNLGPIMTDLADTLCTRGAKSEAFWFLDRARPLMVKAYPDDPWRPAWTDNVKGECLIRAGDRANGTQLVRNSSPVILASWPKASFYGHAASRRLAMSIVTVKRRQ